MSAPKHVCIVGNPIDGISIYGPFVTAEAAGDWAETEARRETWWVAELQTVAPEDCQTDTGIVYSCLLEDTTITETTVDEFLTMSDFDDEFGRILPHIERGEVCMIGGGAQPLVCLWMDTTGEGNDIIEPARAFAIARGEATR